jgi:hypothetical protein
MEEFVLCLLGMMLFYIRFQEQSELNYCDPSQFQAAVEEAFLADQGFVEKLTEDINAVAGNNGCSDDSIIKSFQKVTASNQKKVSQLHDIFSFGFCMAFSDC